MRVGCNPLLWVIAPLLSETAATAIIGPSILLQFVPGIIEVIQHRNLTGLKHVCEIISLLGLVVAGVSLLTQSARREFRDNTGSRAIGELFGYFSIVAFMIFAVMDART